MELKNKIEREIGNKDIITCIKCSKKIKEVNFLYLFYFHFQLNAKRLMTVDNRLCSDCFSKALQSFNQPLIALVRLSYLSETDTIEAFILFNE